MSHAPHEPAILQLQNIESIAPEEPAFSSTVELHYPESEAESQDDIPIALLFPDNRISAAQELAMQYRESTREFLASLYRHNNASSVSMTRPPVWTPSVPPPPYSAPKFNRTRNSSSGGAVLFIASLDMALSISLVMLTFLMNNMRLDRTEPVSLSIAIVYAISAIIGNWSIFTNNLYGLQFYTLVYLMRWTMDAVALSWLMGIGEAKIFGTTLMVAFSLPTAGIRAFYTLLFPCPDVAYNFISGLCPDVATVAAKPINFFYFFMTMVRDFNVAVSAFHGRADTFWHGVY